jgi:predicted transcriptional regulator
MMNMTIGVKLDDTIRERLKAVGTAKRRSTHWLMREAINQFLAREEAELRCQQETLESWERYQTTGEHVSHSAMTAWLETWGTEKEGPCPMLGN